MAKPYRLESLTEREVARWEELATPYETFELFHQRAWLDYLAASRGIDVRMWAIREAGRTVGYFCGGIQQKWPFKLLGSPLKGWGTNFMGPIMNADIDQRRLLDALDGLARTEHIAMAEIENRSLSEHALDAAQYTAVLGWTYQVRLTPQEPAAMWSALDSTCRNRIRKAEKAGLTVEDTDDPDVADEFYDQYTDLMRRKGSVPPYPREYPRLLFRHLRKADLLLALRVRDTSGRILATGLYPHDARTIYFWGGASWDDGRDLCPNEYLHWTAMCRAADQGLTRYDMCGYGRFKKKFGGTLITLKRWHKFYWRSAAMARRGYELYFQKRLRLLARWHHTQPDTGKE